MTMPKKNKSGIKNKTAYLFACVFICVCCYGTEAHAGIKADIVAVVQRAYQWVMTKVEEFTTKYNTAAKKYEEVKILGSSGDTKGEVSELLKGSYADKLVAAGTEAYDSAGSKLDKVKESSLGQAYATNAGAVEGSYEKTKDALGNSGASVALLQKQQNTTKAQMDDIKKVKQDELLGRIEAAQKNVDVRRGMYAATEDENERESLKIAIAEDEMILQQYKSDYDNFSNDETYLLTDYSYKKLKEEYDARDIQIQEEQAKLKEKGSSLGASFANKLASKSSESKSAEYQEMGSTNFVGPDDELNQNAINQIVQQRDANYARDVISAFAIALKTRAEKAEIDDKAEMIADNMMGADYAVTAASLGSEQEIQKIKVLQKKIGLDLAHLKMKASGSMRMQKLRMENPNKDPSVINFDNYVLTKDELLAKGLKEKGNKR